MKSKNATVFIVDDDDSVCTAVCRLLRTVGLSAKAFPSADEFLRLFDPAHAGCLVLDVRMPGLGGLELQETLLEKGARLPIIFITGHGDVPMCARGMKNGAVDFLQKPFNDQALLEAVQRSLEKDAAWREENDELEQLRSHFGSLTPREREVMHLVVAGRLNKQIAAELHASEKTIKVHRGRVMKKMAAASLADLVLKAEAIGVANHGSAQDTRQSRRPIDVPGVHSERLVGNGP